MLGKAEALTLQQSSGRSALQSLRSSGSKESSDSEDLEELEEVLSKSEVLKFI